jgi:predicted nucleotidyltransferase component of viral defense system
VSNDRQSNLAHSVRQRLINLSKERNEDPNLIFIRYALERLLYRLSRSGKANQFILKGAMLFVVWTEKTHRPTRDLDLLGLHDASDSSLVKTFRQILQAKVKPDGLEFDPQSITITDIHEAQDYPGKRIKLLAKLGNAPIRLQIDIGFGDIMTPEAKDIDYPVLLDFPPPHIKVYPCETVIAEKLQAFVAFDMAISRMKDFYDLWVISRWFSFDGEILVKAINATFNRRRTVIPSDTPPALTDEFSGNEDKIIQWKAFLKRNKLEDTAELSKVVQNLRQFLLPPLLSAAKNEIFNKSWYSGGYWSQK